MNRDEADKQINQMCAFILQEAKEKAEEIATKTESEFMADKLNLQTQASITIREDFERKKKDKITDQKILKSKAVTECRFATMRRRDQRVRELKREVMKHLSSISRHDDYPKLVRFLIAQGLLAMQEEEVLIHGRREDLKIIEAQLPEAVKIFQDTIEAASGIRPVCRAVLSKLEEHMLPSGPVEGKETASCCGGVKLSARAGKIVCKNTLDSRLDLCFKELKPQIRGILFGIRPPAKKKSQPVETEHGH